MEKQTLEKEQFLGAGQAWSSVSWNVLAVLHSLDNECQTILQSSHRRIENFIVKTKHFLGGLTSPIHCVCAAYVDQKAASNKSGHCLIHHENVDGVSKQKFPLYQSGLATHVLCLVHLARKRKCLHLIHQFWGRASEFLWETNGSLTLV